MIRVRSDLPPDRLWQPTTARWFTAIFGAALAYAVVRYHLVGDVAWRHFPLFILNKAISLDTQNGRYYYGRAWVHLRSGDKDKAMPDFEKAAEMGDLDAILYLQQ